MGKKVYGLILIALIVSAFGESPCRRYNELAADSTRLSVEEQIELTRTRQACAQWREEERASIRRGRAKPWLVLGIVMAAIAPTVLGIIAYSATHTAGPR